MKIAIFNLRVIFVRNAIYLTMSTNNIKFIIVMDVGYAELEGETTFSTATNATIALGYRLKIVIIVFH